MNKTKTINPRCKVCKQANYAPIPYVKNGLNWKFYQRAKKYGVLYRPCYDKKHPTLSDELKAKEAIILTEKLA